jgi:hypothetical protein
VQAARVEVGRRLAREHPAEADLVIPVPESGTPAAIGFAEQSGIPYGLGLVKNSYVGRTFIQPSQTIRQLGIRLKLNPLRDVLRGKRIVVVDDSIVRGNTQRALVRMLRESGALEVHVRISSPPVKWPCFYGIDFASRAELIANGLDVEGVRRSIGADSLGYVSLDGLVGASEQPASRLCTACFDGSYPIPLPAPSWSASTCWRASSARSPPARPAVRRHAGGAGAHRSGSPVTGPEISYAQAGVDIDAGERAVELMRSAVARTRRPEVVGGLGGFAGLFAFEPGRWRRPLLAASTDGVGTKIAIAQALGRHDTVGRDLVAMVADDLVVCGASRCSCRTTSPAGGWCRSGSPRSSAASPKAARWPAARWSAARPPSTPTSWSRTRTTWPRPRSGWSRRTGCSARTGSRPATRWWRSARPGCTPTATRWSAG